METILTLAIWLSIAAVVGIMLAPLWLGIAAIMRHRRRARRHAQVSKARENLWANSWRDEVKRGNRG